MSACTCGKPVQIAFSDGKPLTVCECTLQRFEALYGKPTQFVVLANKEGK